MAQMKTHGFRLSDHHLQFLDYLAQRNGMNRRETLRMIIDNEMIAYGWEPPDFVRRVSRIERPVDPLVRESRDLIEKLLARR